MLYFIISFGYVEYCLDISCLGQSVWRLEQLNVTGIDEWLYRFNDTGMHIQLYRY